MKALGWFLLIGMVVGTIATIIDHPAVILVLLVVGWLFRNVTWVDR